MKLIVFSLLAFGILTSIVILGVAGYMYKKLQNKNKIRTVNPIIRESTSIPTSQETMIYSKEALQNMQQKDMQDHEESSEKFIKKKTPQIQDTFQTSQPSSISFVPKPALLDAPEEISQTQVLPKNLVPNATFSGNSKSPLSNKTNTPKHISSLDDIAPPEEISGLGFNTSGLAPNRSREISSEENSDESELDPEDSTNIIPK